MNSQAQIKLLQEPWQPKVYDAAELVNLLAISHASARVIVISINGFATRPDLTQKVVPHHDLVTYVKDLVTIAEVPEHPEEIPKPGFWLVGHGWDLDPARSSYRWMPPSNYDKYLHPPEKIIFPTIRFTLRTALRIELVLERREQLNTAANPGYVIDSEETV